LVRIDRRQAVVKDWPSSDIFGQRDHPRRFQKRLQSLCFHFHCNERESFVLIDDRCPVVARLLRHHRLNGWLAHFDDDPERLAIDRTIHQRWDGGEKININGAFAGKILDSPKQRRQHPSILEPFHEQPAVPQPFLGFGLGLGGSRAVLKASATLGR
jgi:hypothetical protein